MLSQESRGEGVVGRAEHCLEVRANAGGEASIRASTKEGIGDLNMRVASVAGRGGKQSRWVER